MIDLAKLEGLRSQLRGRVAALGGMSLEADRLAQVARDYRLLVVNAMSAAQIRDYGDDLAALLTLPPAELSSLSFINVNDLREAVAAADQARQIRAEIEVLDVEVQNVNQLVKRLDAYVKESA